MSALYLTLLGAVCATVFALMLDAMARVTRKPVWHDHRSIYAAPEAPAMLVEQRREPVAAPFVPVEVLAVDARHSGFAGLTNAEDFQLTA